MNSSIGGKWIIGLAAAALLALAALVGCGGGDSTASEAAPQSKAQFAKQAEAICTQSHKELEAGYTEAEGEIKKKNGLVTVSETIVIPNLTAELEKLEELGPPKGEEAKAEAFVKAVEAAVAEGESNPNSLVGPKPWERIGKTASALGLRECAQAS